MKKLLLLTLGLGVAINANAHYQPITITNYSGHELTLTLGNSVCMTGDWGSYTIANNAVQPIDLGTDDDFGCIYDGNFIAGYSIKMSGTGSDVENFNKISPVLNAQWDDSGWSYVAFPNPLNNCSKLTAPFLITRYGVNFNVQPNPNYNPEATCDAE